MAMSLYKIRRGLRTFGLTALLLWHGSAFGQDEGIAVLVHGSAPQARQAATFTRAMFTLRARSLPDGTPVRLFVLGDNHPVHKEFCDSVLGTFPYVLRHTWDQALFSGTGLIPVEVSSPEEMLHQLQATPGAVGYLPYSRDLNDAIAGTPIVIINAPRTTP